MPISITCPSPLRVACPAFTESISTLSTSPVRLVTLDLVMNFSVVMESERVW